MSCVNEVLRICLFLVERLLGTGFFWGVLKNEMDIYLRVLELIGVLIISDLAAEFTGLEASAFKLVNSLTVFYEKTTSHKKRSTRPLFV